MGSPVPAHGGGSAEAWGVSPTSSEPAVPNTGMSRGILGRPRSMSARPSLDDQPARGTVMGSAGLCGPGCGGRAGRGNSVDLLRLCEPGQPQSACAWTRCHHGACPGMHTRMHTCTQHTRTHSRSTHVHTHMHTAHTQARSTHTHACMQDTHTAHMPTCSTCTHTCTHSTHADQTRMYAAHMHARSSRGP